MQVECIDHIQLAMPAGEEAAARQFYAGLLGISEVPKPAKLAARGGVWFERGALRVHLGIEEDFVAAKKAHPAFLVSDLPSLVKQLQNAGLRIKDDDDLPGFYRVYVNDPFGNRLEFMEAKPNL